MDRRTAVALVAVALVTVSGCSAASEAVGELGEQRHPFADETVAVAVDGTDRERALTRDALTYWESHAAEYAGFETEFRLVDPGETPTTAGPIVEVRFVETVGDCGDTDYSAGCAPRINATTRVDWPATVRVQRGFDDDSTRLVAMHEVGHLLGRSHDDAPRDVMRHERALATLPRPNASERPVPWNDSTLTVAVRGEGLSDAERAAYREEVAYAAAYVGEGADGTVPANVSVDVVDDPETADVVVEPVASAECRPDAGSCARVEGTDPDADGAIETYTRVEILLVDLDREAASWHVARQLLVAFGVDEAAIPARLADATYDERRGAWHG
ncbi:M10 family metallopeptidase domain-containing protein [Haloarcula marina]|uniref:M10 family metallopeptidase domain-containing protein n=1 Tax=Haloarcula marina TaxID=2961574 RepID=UPI0020B8299F|nr:M10 family metallopeptidase domain-containing protein [Halomicroarcula marina]